MTASPSAAPPVPPAARPVHLVVNGVATTLDVEPRVSLLDALREHLHLTGTKKGCNQGACGACTVLVDGRRIVSCLALAVQYQGREVTTIEGVGPHPLQDAFVHFDGLQCGYCTPGQLCSAVGMLAEHAAGAASAVTADVTSAPELSRAEIRERMSGNLCRCGAYNGIVDAIASVAGESVDGEVPA
jgi:xanthine dehydrogenase YagT iron-sulfur-binding subunit